MELEQRIQEAREEMAIREDPPADVAWWCECGNVSALFDWLVANDELALDREEISYFLSKPWKWGHEWNRMNEERKQP
jgi:hypothetical protein